VLSPTEERDLVESVGRHAERSVRDALLRFLKPCYLAFQFGFYFEAEAASGSGVESERLGEASRRYLHQLVTALASPSFAPGAIT
jgi:hypothetical protein